jgi:ArsR family transcriptional regulator
VNDKTKRRYEARARVIKALAHPARLMMVDELGKHGERCVCELTELVGTDMSTVSRHLTQLKQAGIVEDERRGQMVYYRLAVCCLPEFFACIESVVRGDNKVRVELTK